MYYDYEEELKKEVRDYIEEEHLQEKIKNRSLDNIDLVEEIRDNSFITEGKIYTSEARECLLGNEDLLAEALENADLPVADDNLLDKEDFSENEGELLTENDLTDFAEV